MRCVRVSSNSLHIFAFVFLTSFLLASLIAPASTATQRPSSSNVIRVWTVGSPHRDVLPPAVVPPELLQRAKSLGYSIEVESFRAADFTAKFREAVQDHNEPEVLTFDNYGVIAGVRTSMGWFEGAYSDRQIASSLVLVHEALSSLQSRGWVMLVRSAVNFEAARALSMQPAECELQGPTAHSPAIEPALRQAQEKAVLATRAYLGCDRSALSGISDGSRLVQQCFMPQSNTKIESVKACRASGNHKLAFVSLVSLFSAEVREPGTVSRIKMPGIELGQQSIFAVLRNENGDWRLLAITHDPINVNTVARRPVTNANAFVNSLDQTQLAGTMPDPAQPLTPDGIYPLPQTKERFGDFVWQPSQSPDVIGQVVEFMWGKDTNFGLTRLFFLPASENKISTGFLMDGGTSVWRVWSISKAGDVAFSEQHSFLSR